MPERKTLLKQMANKANAQKSTGPRTPQGKARCARNPCKHGLLSRQVVVADVDGAGAAEFEKLLESLHAQFQPADAVEHALVDRVASCYWRLRRAQRYEVGAVGDAFEHDQFTSCPGRRVASLSSDIRRLSIPLGIEKFVLHALQKPAEQLAGHERAERDSALRAAAESLQPPAQDIKDPVVLQAALKAQQARVTELEDLIRDCRSRLPDAQERDLQACARLPLLAALPKADELHRLIRYETMLDRQLHRALRELRHRQTRRDQDPHETPQPGAITERTPREQ